jgi:parallel beta-helix repeat protein
MRSIRRPALQTILLVGLPFLVILGVLALHPPKLKPSSKPLVWGHAVGPTPALTCTGKALQPGMDLQRVIDTAPSATTFCFARGLYRLTEPLVPKANDVLIGTGSTVLDGSRPVDRWTREGDRWVATGYLPFRRPLSYNEIFECAPKGTTACRYNEAVFLDDRPLRRVMSQDALGPGSFFEDYAANRIWLSDDPRQHRVEVAVARYLIGPNGATDLKGVQIENLIVQKSASSAYEGGIDSGGSSSWIVQRVESRLNHGIGIQLNGPSQIIDSSIHDNGSLGIAGNTSSTGEGEGKVITGNDITRNNWAGFYWAWQAGGIKLFHSRGLIFRGNHVHHNHGIGLWEDLGNSDSLIEGNIFAQNERHGIAIEGSRAVTIRENSIIGNGTDGYDAGVYLLDSGDNEVTGNKLVGNHRGILLHNTDSPDAYLVRNSVHDNDVALPFGSYSGLINDSSDPSSWDGRGNQFWRNTWRLASLDGEHFVWQGRRTTKDGWQWLGQDAEGSFVAL